MFKFKIPFTNKVILLSKITCKSYGGRKPDGTLIHCNTSYSFAISFTSLEYTNDPLKCIQCDI